MCAYIESFGSPAVEFLNFVPSCSMSTDSVSGVKVGITRALIIFHAFAAARGASMVTKLGPRVAVQDSYGHFVSQSGFSGSALLGLHPALGHGTGGLNIALFVGGRASLHRV